MVILMSIGCNAQEETIEPGNKGNHRIAIALSHANVSEGVENGDSKWLSLPAWGLDYDYWISDKWAIGIHTDIIVEDFEVKTNLDDNEETIERSSPVAPAVVSIFKPT